MKLSKFLKIIIAVTCLSLLYVYQQNEIFRLAYVRQKRLSVFEDLLDKNSILRYNIQKNASLVYIGNRISESADFQMPDTYRLVRLTPAGTGSRIVREGKNSENMLSRLFGIKRQAEARTIKP